MLKVYFCNNSIFIPDSMTMIRLTILFLVLFLFNVSTLRAQQRELTPVDAKYLRGAKLWTKVVMREIDLTNAFNTPLQEMKDTAGHNLTINQMFYRIVKGLQMATYEPAGNTIIVGDSTLAFLTKEIRRDDSTSISKYIVLEEWMFDRDMGKMVVFIKWIGPYMSGKEIEDEKKRNKSSKQQFRVGKNEIHCVSLAYRPLFAIKYDDLKKEFAKYQVDLSDGEKARMMSVLDFFELRQFNSKIVCVEDKYD